MLNESAQSQGELESAFAAGDRQVTRYAHGMDEYGRTEYRYCRITPGRVAVADAWAFRYDGNSADEGGDHVAGTLTNRATRQSYPVKVYVAGNRENMASGTFYLGAEWEDRLPVLPDGRRGYFADMQLAEAFHWLSRSVAW